MKIKTILGLALASAALNVAAEEVTIAVAANFTDATKQVVPAFEKATGHSVKVSFGSTGKLFSQIENGAPFEVFLAADSKRPELAEAEGLGVAGTRFTYATGKVVLWSADPTKVAEGGEVLKSDVSRVAIANPKTAPYGLAAQEVMQKMGVWDDLEGRIVRGDSIAQTFQFVVTGNAPVGFVALSQVKALPEDEKGSAWVIPQSLYAPIEQQAILLKTGEDNPVAREYLEFLKGEEARAIIESFGYGVGSSGRFVDGRSGTGFTARP